MNLIDIPVRVLDQSTGMANVLMTELSGYLQQLAEQGQTNVIDLKGLPMSETDINELADMLGVGEVKAKITGIGSSSIRETAYRGIWWVTHYGDDDKVLAELIEITKVPEILVTHIDEIKHSAESMSKLHNMSK